MLANKVLTDAMVDLLAADTATLAAATAMHVHLISEPFTPTDGTELADLTEATFTGSTAKNAGTGTQQVFVDPVSGLRLIQLLEPAGGWTWECTVDPGAPETIWGFAVTDTANAVTWGSALLPAPVTIFSAGEGLAIGQVRFSLVNPSLI